MRSGVEIRSIAGCRKGWAARRAALEIVRTVGQVKSACHERRKPLTRLGFSVAGGSVACKRHGFWQGFQRVCVAGSGLHPRGSRS